MERKEIRGIIAEVKEKGNDSRVFFPWDDVFASMLEKPEKVGSQTRCARTVGRISWSFTSLLLHGHGRDFVEGLE